MEDIYRSLFSSTDLLWEQVVRQMFELSAPEGAVMIFADEKHHYQANYPSRVPFLNEDSGQFSAICRQIDDGDDPCVCVVDGGCVVGTQMLTEKVNCGYFLVFLPGYTSQTVQVNMDIIELLLAQAQLICQLIEKNNQLHHMQLDHMRKTSQVLS